MAFPYLPQVPFLILVEFEELASHGIPIVLAFEKLARACRDQKRNCRKVISVGLKTSQQTDPNSLLLLALTLQFGPPLQLS